MSLKLKEGSCCSAWVWLQGFSSKDVFPVQQLSKHDVKLHYFISYCMYIFSTCWHTLVTVAVSPADSSWVLPKEAPGIGLTVRVPAVAVVSQPAARVLHDIVWKLCPLQTRGARVCLGHGAVVVSQLGKSLRAGQRDCPGRKKSR